MFILQVSNQYIGHDAKVGKTTIQVFFSPFRLSSPQLDFGPQLGGILRTKQQMRAVHMAGAMFLGTPGMPTTCIMEARHNRHRKLHCTSGPNIDVVVHRECGIRLEHLACTMYAHGHGPRTKARCT